MDSQMLQKVEKLLKLNSQAKNNKDPLITRAMAEVELAKSNSSLVGSQKEQQQALNRMGIKFSANGGIEK